MRGFLGLRVVKGCNERADALEAQVCGIRRPLAPGGYGESGMGGF
jgi:hypothetical protein